jgi:hypothetical protein
VDGQFHVVLLLNKQHTDVEATWYEGQITKLIQSAFIGEEGCQMIHQSNTPVVWETTFIMSAW